MLQLNIYIMWLWAFFRAIYLERLRFCQTKLRKWMFLYSKMSYLFAFIINTWWKSLPITTHNNTWYVWGKKHIRDHCRAKKWGLSTGKIQKRAYWWLHLSFTFAARTKQCFVGKSVKVKENRRKKSNKTVPSIFPYIFFLFIPSFFLMFLFFFDEPEILSHFDS